MVSPFPQPLATGNHCSALCHLHVCLISLNKMLSWFLHVVHAPVVCPFLMVNIFHSMDVPQCFSMYQLNAICVVSSVWLLIMLLWTFMYWYLCECELSFLLDIYLGVELLGHGNSMFNSSEELKSFSKVVYTILHSYQQCLSGPVSPHPCQWCVFHCSYPRSCEVPSHCGIDLHFHND